MRGSAFGDATEVRPDSRLARPVKCHVHEVLASTFESSVRFPSTNLSMCLLSSWS